MYTNKTSFLVYLCAGIFLAVSCTKTTENAVPVAHAGPSKTITLPTDTVTLSGSGSDTDGHVVAYLWSQISGPASTTIVNPGSPTTLVKGFVAGKFVFQLMVTDNKGATGVDTVSVTVNPSPERTLTLQPANNTGEFQLALYNGADQSSFGTIDIPVEAWTRNGLPLTIRELIKFDLSSIPAKATIKSAKLYLYSYPPPASNGNFTDPNYGPNNMMLVQQVTSNWSTSSVNWFSQPATSTSNQVVVPTTTQSVLDLNLDVTGMVASMVTGNVNYGFMLRLQNEATYNSRIFVSSFENKYPDKHPKLVVTYQ